MSTPVGFGPLIPLKSHHVGCESKRPHHLACQRQDQGEGMYVQSLRSSPLGHVGAGKHRTQDCSLLSPSCDSLNPTVLGICLVKGAPRAEFFSKRTVNVIFALFNNNEEKRKRKGKEAARGKYFSGAPDSAPMHSVFVTTLCVPGPRSIFTLPEASAAVDGLSDLKVFSYSNWNMSEKPNSLCVICCSNCRNGGKG